MKLNNKGFNLIVMSIIVLVMSIIMSATISFYNLKNVKEKVQDTESKFKTIDLAIRKYADENGRLPCPAPLNCTVSDGCSNSSYSIGFENGSPVANIDGNCANISGGIFKNSDSSVYYGGIPASTLGLSSDFLVDSWGNKITYMVSSNLTALNGFNEMIYKSRNDASITSYIRDGIIYLLMSFNKSNAKAFSINSQVYFSGTDEDQISIINDFVNNGPNTDYYNYYKKYTDFDVTDLEKQIQKCHAVSGVTDLDGISGQSFSFPESNYGELVFANENCGGNSITIQDQSVNPNYDINGSNDYYRLSTFIDKGTVNIDGRPALKCGENGVWNEDFIYHCKIASKCQISDLQLIYPNANLPSFNIANTGTVKFYEDKNNSSSNLITEICISNPLSNGTWESKWYRKE